MSNLAAGGFGPSGDTLKALETEIKAGALCLEPQSQAEAILTASLATREYVPPHEIDHSIQDCQVWVSTPTCFKGSTCEKLLMAAKPPNVLSTWEFVQRFSE